ncbi:MAG: hypothetical protein KGS48_09990 [Bacteroidetes bacterium]|nr:hypothetical protein [Bacteroidota bacterium]
MYKILLSFLLLFCSEALFAQCFPSENCDDFNSCIFGRSQLNNQIWDNYNATPSFGNPVCGAIAIHNDQWFKFVADGPTLELAVHCLKSLTGDGLQIALFDQCNNDALNCNPGKLGGASDPLILTYFNLIPGKTYLLLIDGYIDDRCEYQFEVVSGVADVNYSANITGHVLIDQNDNCIADSLDTPVSDVSVSASGLNSITVPTDSIGHYQFSLFDTSSLVVSLWPIVGDFWSVCSDSIPVKWSASPTDSTFRDTIDFVLKPKNTCPLAFVSAALAPRLRSCIPAYWNVKFGNYGTVVANDVKVYIIKPHDINILEYSNLFPYVLQGDTIVYTVGNVSPLVFKNLVFKIEPPCDNSLFGQTLCFEAQVTLGNKCPEVAISHPKIKLEASCLGDSTVHFTVYNKGGAPTITPFQYSVYKNDQLVANQSFTLLNGASFILDFPSNGETWRLESTRDDSGAKTSVTLESCGGLTPNQVNLFWQEDPDLDRTILCRTVQGSYDPNAKFVFPEGVGSEHIIGNQQALEYIIEFQNTGTDTAYQVRLRDELSPALDLLTFRAGASTHPNKWQIVDRVLQVDFDPIALPDTNTNVQNSSGWFQFFINPLSDLPDGTQIQNTASIYFDYNAAVQTNTVWHTIGRLSVKVDELPNKQASLWRVLGNPATAQCIFERTTPTAYDTRLELYHANGRLVRVLHIPAGAQGLLEREGLPNGAYYFRLMENGNLTGSGQLQFH